MKRDSTTGHRPGCYNFLYELIQGRTYGAPGLTALAVNSEGGREQLRGKNGQGDPP
jgi:hypothetical protein